MNSCCKHVDFGAVDLEQRLAGRHDVASGVDAELLDPAAELGRDHRLAPFVELHRGEGTHGTREGAFLDHLAANPEPLHLVEAHLHGARRLAGLVLADRDIVHVHGVLLRHRRGVGSSMGLR